LEKLVKLIDIFHHSIPDILKEAIPLDKSIAMVPL